MPHRHFEAGEEVNNLGLRTKTEQDPYVPVEEIEDSGLYGMSPDEIIMLRETMEEEGLDRILKGEYLASPEEGSDPKGFDHVFKRNRILRKCMEKLQHEIDTSRPEDIIRELNKEKIAKIEKMLDPHRKPKDESAERIAA